MSAKNADDGTKVRAEAARAIGQQERAKRSAAAKKAAATRARRRHELMTCEGCGALEERVFTDSWTGLQVCLQCLAPVAGQITNSPHSERDNIRELIEFEGAEV